MMNVLLSFAQFERELASERTRDKIAATRRKGKWTGGRPILGYDVDRSNPGSIRLVTNEDEAERVRRIFDLYAEHESLTAVIRILDERGWRTKRWTTKKGIETGGGCFDKGKLHRLLTNQTYRGKITYRDELHEGEHEAIVPEPLWRKVQILLQRNGRSGGREVRNKYGALLRGVLYCGSCGCAMTHAYTKKGSKIYRYYVCANAQKRGWHACPTKSVPAGEIKRYVEEQIRGIGRDPDLVAETLEQTRRVAEEGETKLTRERAILERELRRDQAALGTSSDPDRLADIHERIGTAERRLRIITEEICHLRNGVVGADELRTALANFDELWQALTVREQVRVIELLIERIEYDGEAGTVSITSPARRASARWKKEAGGMSVTITRRVQFNGGARGRKRLEDATPALGEVPASGGCRPSECPAISRLMALAIRMQGLLEEGHVRDYAELARLGHVTRARVSQIMNLLNLAPDIQEDLLFLPRVEQGRDPIREHAVRPITATSDWGKQRRMWQTLIQQSSHHNNTT